MNDLGVLLGGLVVAVIVVLKLVLPFVEIVRDAMRKPPDDS